MSQTYRTTEPRYMRKTAVGDGAYEISTVDVGPLVSMPETIIFDESDGCAYYREVHADATSIADLDAAHEEIVQAFASGVITLGDHQV